LALLIVPSRVGQLWLGEELAGLAGGLGGTLLAGGPSVRDPDGTLDAGKDGRQERK
jgi:hypothetical protein